MSETPSSSPSSGPDDAARRLERVVDDATPREAWGAWVREQLISGKDADSLLSELIAQGWDAETAEAIVEEQRRATRHLRGCVTYEQVAAAAGRRYRDSFRFGFRMAVGGLPLICAHFLVSSLVALFKRKRRDSAD